MPELKIKRKRKGSEKRGMNGRILGEPYPHESKGE